MAQQRIGVIGGGQLAWMMGLVAPRLDLQLIVQTPQADDPATSVASDVILAPVDDAQATAKLVKQVDVTTFENEFVDLVALKRIETQGACFRPRLSVLEPLLDKYHQRRYLQSIGLPVPKFQALSDDSPENPFGYPVVMKARRHGYDGQGTFILHSLEELEKHCQSEAKVPMMLEEFVPFERELAAIAARGVTGEVVLLPIVETVQKNQVCHRVFAPADITEELEQEIKAIAEKLLTELDAVGVFGIEFFLTTQEQVLVNEIAPRTHNSGHFSLDACDVSQFELHLRAVAGLPLPTPQLLTQGAVMVNLLGYEKAQSNYPQQRERLSALPNTFVHWYGKTAARPGRKLGHVTALLNSSIDSITPSQAREALEQQAQVIESIWYG